jgi:hypothetical protein
MQFVEFALQLGENLTLVVDLALLTVLPVLPILAKATALQQIDHLRQAILQGLLGLFCFYFCHGALHPGREHAREINQSIRDWQIGNVNDYWVSP